MKLLHSLALLAVFLLVADNVLPSQASWLPSWSKKDDQKDGEVKTKENLTVRDEEINDPDDEKLNDIDGVDYREEAVPVGKPVPGQVNLAMPFAVDEVKPKIQIQDEPEDSLTDIKTIHELPNQASLNATNPAYTPYDREPQQSEFVERGPHPTESQGMDPRFNRPRSCADGQYLCRKAHPQQEHIRCIPNEWKCNGVRDCEENDDEEGCAINVHRPAPNQCNTPYQYTCYGTGINGIPAQCIDSSKVCDGTYDCSYGDDESSERCRTQAATRREETSAQPGSPEAQNLNGQSQPTNGETRPVQQAPQYNPYPVAQPAAPQPQPQEQCNGGRSEEYIKRLEWVDRCFRSCLKN